MKRPVSVRQRKLIPLLVAFLLIAVLYRLTVEGHLASWVGGITYGDKVQKLVEKVAREVSELRGLPEVSGVSAKVVSSEFFKSGTRESLAENPKLVMQEALYKALLIVPADFSILEKKVSMTGMILAAAAGTTIYVVREYFNPFVQDALGTVAHEYTHVLQYMYQPSHVAKTLDCDLALSALIEGEACLVAKMYTANVTGKELLLQSPEPLTKKSLADDQGWVLDRLFWFPYRFGEGFVYRIYQEGGWEAVNRVYAKPPQSSAQILDPEHFSAEFEPALLPNPKPLHGNWSTSYSDTLGIYCIMILLLQALEPTVVEEVCLTWLGDNATIYISDGAYLLQWQTQWRNTESASMFAETLINFFQSIGGVAEDGLYWSFDGRLVTLTQIDSKVIVVGSSDRQLLIEEIEWFSFIAAQNSG